MRTQDAVRQTDAHHEVFSCESLSAFTADSANTIALRVDSPPLEIRVCPFWRDAAASISSELPNLLDVLPGIQFSFQTLDLLRLRFLNDLRCVCHEILQK